MASSRRLHLTELPSVRPEAYTRQCSLFIEQQGGSVMRAMIFEELGGPEVLHPVDLPEPVPGPGEVSIDVAYAGINFADVLARAEGYRVDALPFRPGLEVSGRVLAVGEGVTAFAPGQEVSSFLRGGGYS